MSQVRPITVRVGPRVLLASMIFMVVLVVLGILTAAVLSALPETCSFWKSADGIAVAEIAVALLSSATLLPALLWGLSEGWIAVDSSGMRWKIRGERGEIRWDRPFTVRRWQSTMTTLMAGDGSGPPGEQAFPLIVYEISQGDTRLVFYRGAGFDEVKGLPVGEREGVMLFWRARRFTRIVDRLMRKGLDKRCY